MNAVEDPGWRPALRPIWTLLVPWIAILIRERRLDLIGLRRIFLHVGITLVEVAIVIPWAFSGSDRDATWAWIVLGIGSAAALGGLLWSVNPGWRAPADPAQLNADAAVADAFRGLSFIRLAFAASPAMYGIVGAELTGDAAISLVGAGASVALMAAYGPTRSRIDEIQERLRISGSRISLRSALDQTAS